MLYASELKILTKSLNDNSLISSNDFKYLDYTIFFKLYVPSTKFERLDS